MPWVHRLWVGSSKDRRPPENPEATRELVASTGEVDLAIRVFRQLEVVLREEGVAFRGCGQTGPDQAH